MCSEKYENVLNFISSGKVCGHRKGLHTRKKEENNENKKITRNELTNDKRVSTMKLRFNYNKIAGLCWIHNIVGSSKDNQGKYIWMRIMKGKIIRAGQGSASSMEGALSFM